MSTSKPVKYAREAIDLLRRAAAGESVEIGPRQATALLAKLKAADKMARQANRAAGDLGYCDMRLLTAIEDYEKQ